MIDSILLLCKLMTTSSKMIGELSSRKVCAAMIYSLLSLPDEIPDFNRWKNRVLDVTGIEFDQSMKTLFNNLIGWHLEMMEKNEPFLNLR